MQFTGMQRVHRKSSFSCDELMGQQKFFRARRPGNSIWRTAIHIGRNSLSGRSCGTAAATGLTCGQLRMRLTNRLDQDTKALVACLQQRA